MNEPAVPGVNEPAVPGVSPGGGGVHAGAEDQEIIRLYASEELTLHAGLVRRGRYVYVASLGSPSGVPASRRPVLAAWRPEQPVR